MAARPTVKVSLVSEREIQKGGMQNPLISYVPQDRLAALARGRELPELATGSALFADISGFTPLTNAMVQQFGARRGAEEATRHLNMVYGALLEEVHRRGGSIISFSGDGVLCWFDKGGDGTPQRSAAQAVGAALAMQRQMARLADIEISGDLTIELAMKSAVATGTVRRYLVGEPDIQRLEVLAGSVIDRVGDGERLAERGETVVDAASAAYLGSHTVIDDHRHGAEGHEEYAVVSALSMDVEAALPDSEPRALLSEADVRPWLIPEVYARVGAGQEDYLAELRPALALFVRFGGLDYDGDDGAGHKLDTYVRWVQRILARFGGTLIQLTTGDKGSYLYAAFGAPVGHDDDAHRAAVAALELINPPPDLEFAPIPQIGMMHGRMRTGAYGSERRKTYGVQGAAVNMAARLMMYAQPGQVIVHNNMVAALGEQFELKSLGSISVKGSEEPVSVHQILGVAQQRTQRIQRTLAGRLGPLIGRQWELGEMAAALDMAMGGQGRIVLVEGAAGLGKSVLVQEFASLAEGKGAVVTTGACQSTSRESAFFAARQVARTVLGLDELADSPATEQIEHVEAAITLMNPHWAVRLPLLGDLLGLPIPDTPTTDAFDTRLRQEALVTLVVDVVRYCATKDPMVLVFEDVHWLDEASQRIVLGLARTVASSRLLLLLVQRPRHQGQDLFMDEVAELDHQTLLRLDGLSGDAVKDLVQTRLKGNTSSLLLDLVHLQSQGNPFYVEELVDELREAGNLVQEEGVWSLAPAIMDALHSSSSLERIDGEWVLAEDADLAAASLGVPDSIHGIVLARADRMAEDPKLTLKVASVVGREFDPDLLMQVHPAQPSRAEIMAHIGEFEARDVARAAIVEGRKIYRFRHSITQEVVYETLLARQLSELHLSVATALEQRAREPAEDLAYHYYRSDLTVPRVRDKALHYLELAGMRAQKEYANETALSYFDRALGIEKRWPWLKAKYEVLHMLGRRDEERATLEVLEDAPNASASEVAYLWAQYHEAVNEYDEAESAMSALVVKCYQRGPFFGAGAGIHIARRNRPQSREAR